MTSISRSESERSPASLLAGVEIILVDDNDDLRELLVHVLREHGATVTDAWNAGAAYELVVATSPDLLISDIAMPNEDGYSLIRRVRALPEPLGLTAAIAFTAFAEPDDRWRAIEAGFDAHVSKTTTMASMVAIVRRLIRARVSGVHPIIAV